MKNRQALVLDQYMV